MAVTLFSRAATAFLLWAFGEVVVRERHIPRALRIFRATLEEYDLDPDSIAPQVYEALIGEIIERARFRDSDGELRWKHLMAEILLVGECVSSAVNERPMADKRIRDILLLHRLI